VNKRKRKQQKKLSTPLVALLIGGALLLVTAVIFFVFGGGSDGGGTPKLVVDQDKIDYGYVKFGENKTFAIKITNTGDGTLRFKEKPFVEVLEGC
jgi:hypothetical protein